MLQTLAKSAVQEELTFVDRSRLFCADHECFTSSFNIAMHSILAERLRQCQIHKFTVSVHRLLNKITEHPITQWRFATKNSDDSTCIIHHKSCLACKWLLQSPEVLILMKFPTAPLYHAASKLSA